MWGNAVVDVHEDRERLHEGFLIMQNGFDQGAFREVPLWLSEALSDVLMTLARHDRDKARIESI